MDSVALYTCPICGNSNINSIGVRNGRPYCRKCISFRGEEVSEAQSYTKSAPVYIDYDLSTDQKRLAGEILKNYKNGNNTLVHAVCGSGKTEIVLAVISYAIRCGEKVGFAIPRRDVVIEIHQRFKQIFKKNNVVSVYGGHTDIIQGDLVVLTTHQLYRYYHYFDLLIVDEIDAFPYKNNDVLNAFFHRAVRGHYVLMSATPSKEVLLEFSKNNNKIVELFSRFHEYPLPEPKIIIKNRFILFAVLIEQLSSFIKSEKQVFVFFPTIEMAVDTYNLASVFIKGGECVHSKKKDRDKIIERFRNKQYKYLFTTAVLERGVTIKDAQVIVYRADHNIYDEHSLIQIAGRVGRKKDAPTGEVIFLANEQTEAMSKAVYEIKRANKNLQNLL